MSTWSFGTIPSATPAPAFGSSFGLGTTTSATAPSLGGSFFGGLGTSSATNAKPTSGFSGFGGFSQAPATTTSSMFPPANSATASTAPVGNSIFGSTPISTNYAFPTKSAEKDGSVDSSTPTAVASNKAGSTGKKPKENIVQEQLVPDICELEKKIQRYQKIQSDAETYSLQDAVEWDAEMKRFDASATRVKNQLMDTFTTIDLLRKNTARLRSQNLLSSRLFNNPASYYSVASSVEMYFMEVMSGLRTELEIFEEELQHLENLHEDLIRPGDRFNPLDLQETYMYLSKIVNGVAIAVEEVAKVGDELRREIQANKGTAAPIPVPQQPFLVQDISQLSSARSLFSATLVGPSASVFGSLATSKSPLLQPMNPEIQSSMFNPAMRSLTRMDSTSGMSPSQPSSPQMSRLNPSYFLGTASPGF